MCISKSPGYHLRRPSGYYLRSAFPRPWRPVLGGELRRALNTSNLRPARQKAAALATIVFDFCASTTERGSGQHRRDELKQRLDALLREQIEFTDRYLAALPATDDEGIYEEAWTYPGAVGATDELPLVVRTCRAG